MCLVSSKENSLLPLAILESHSCFSKLWRTLDRIAWYVKLKLIWLLSKVLYLRIIFRTHFDKATNCFLCFLPFERYTFLISFAENLRRTIRYNWNFFTTRSGGLIKLSFLIIILLLLASNIHWIKYNAKLSCDNYKLYYE